MQFMTAKDRRSRTMGAVNGQLIAIIGLLVVVVALSGLSAWLYTMYDEQKTKVDNKIDLAVAAAKKEQAEADEIKMRKIEEEPNREFAGPDDYGRLTFKYPKNWSVYVDSDVTSSGDTYTAYLNPIVVPPVGDRSAQFALRVTIESIDYDRALGKYANAIKKGEVNSKPVTFNGHDGTRLEGNFTKDIRGSAIVFKLRDKTVTLQTDADTFRSYFDTIIETVDFNS